MSNRQKIRKLFPALKAEDELEIEKATEALFRVIVAAKRPDPGLDPEDFAAAMFWPFRWYLEYQRRQELEPLAEIGRKVSNSRKRDQKSLEQRGIEIAFAAFKLGLVKGKWKPRGLAGKVKKQLRLQDTPRNINRILNQYMPSVIRVLRNSE